MTKRMLIEATHPEETRVVVVDGKKLEEFDYESATKRQLKGNIYLAKVTRVEPSLQAAFVEYGGNRHGFLAFSEIHPDYYRIPVEDRDAILAEHAAMQAAEDHGADGEEDLAGNLRRDIGERSESDNSGESDLAEDGSAAADAALPLAFHAESLAGPLFEGDGSHDDGLDDAGDEPGDAPASAQSDQPREDTAGSGEHHSHDDTHEDGGHHEHHGHEEHDHEEHHQDGGDHEHHDEQHDHRDDSVQAGSPGESAPPRRPELIETFGGDEAEEMRRRRSRPHRRYKIQEVIKRRQIMLVQVTKEERGNKGAALTSYLSLAGRYCVLMPNTGRGGGISRKITSAGDRKRLKSILEDFSIPDGMAVIVRTAGSERNKTELRRDYDYLLRLWDEIREHTLKSSAPALIYEEASLIKRAIRDLYARDIDEVLVEGEEAYKAAKNFMRMLMPSHAKRVQLYKDPTVHLLQRHQVEGQLDAIHNPIVHLKSGGYIVINSTEALVAIDVNSGRATRERNIEETALRTNLEAADEVARQLRLRDLAGLIVIDFIDMEESRNNAAVERRLKEAMRNDRARIQVGRISAFGLLELSRQRLRPSLIEASTETCRHCRGTGHVRSTESTALHVLRAIEEEGAKARGSILTVAVPTSVALYVLNNKRAALADIESKHGLRVILSGDESLIPPDHRIERSRAPLPGIEFRQPVSQAEVDVDVDVDEAEPEIDEPSETREPIAQPNADHPSHEGRRRPRRRRRRRDEGRHGQGPSHAPSHAPFPVEPSAISTSAAAPEPTGDDEPRADMPHAGPPDHGGGASDEGGQRRRRRRGRRGGRRRRRGEGRDGEGSPTGSFNGGSQQTHRTGGEHGQSYRDSGPNDRPEPANEPAPESSGYSDQPASYSEPRFEHEQVRADDSRRSDQPSSTPTSHRHEPEPEVRVIPETRESDETPSSSPRRGWWKRLVE